MTNQTETMSAEEAADYLKASVRTVQELAMDGKLKGAKVGKGWVFFRRDVVAYLEGRIYGAPVWIGVDYAAGYKPPQEGAQ